MAQQHPRKTVFFDRDGTLIIDRVYLNDPDQITYLDGVFEALTLLKNAGYLFVMVTNQSGVARGIVTIGNLDEIHRRMTDEFEKHGISFEGIYYAPYSVESNHELRKPNPGMLLAAAKDHGLSLVGSWMVGDRVSDVEAGRRAGCRTVLLEGVESAESLTKAAPEIVASDILTAAKAILAHDARLAQ